MTVTEPTGDAPNFEVTPYELVGGEATVRRLADRFYEIMDTDPGAARIRAMRERLHHKQWARHFIMPS